MDARYISGSELSRRAGVSRSAISKAVSRYRLPVGNDGLFDLQHPDVAAYIEFEPEQRRSVKRRKRAMASTKAQISGQTSHMVGSGRVQGPLPRTDAGTGQFAGGLNPSGTAPKNGGYGPGGGGDAPDPESRAAYESRKIKATAEKYELQNRIIRHKYVPIEDARAVFGKIYSVHTGILTPLSAKLSDQLAAEFGVRDPEKVLRGTRILNDELFLALSQIKREIDEFLEKEGERVVTESEELALTLDDGSEE